MFGFNKVDQERVEEKRNAIRNIILRKLEDAHQQEVKTIRESDEYVNFEKTFKAENPKAVALNEAITMLKTAAKDAKEYLENVVPGEFYVQEVLRTYHLENQLDELVSVEKRKAFPRLRESFNRWEVSSAIEDYLIVYDDLKDVEKIVDEVVGRVNS